MLSLLTALLGADEWILDYLNDPAGPMLLPRLAIVWMPIPAWAVWRTSDHNFAPRFALAALTRAQLQDIAIHKAPAGGMTAAVMTIVYPTVALSLCLGFSMFVNWATLTLVSISPFLLAPTGWLANFPSQLSGMVIWPTSIFLAFICVAFAFGDHPCHLGIKFFAVWPDPSC